MKRIFFSLALVACGSSTPDAIPDASTAEAGVATTLDGMRIELPCTETDAAIGCGATIPADVVRVMNGDANTLYQVRIRVRGVVEEKSYRHGTLVDGTNAGMLSGGNVSDDVSSVYTIDIDSPPQTLYLNRGTSLRSYCLPLDYEATITVAAGAHVTLSADPVGATQNENVDDSNQPVVVASADVAPYPQAFNGQFVQLNVIDAVALPQGAPARIDAIVFDGAIARRTLTTTSWAAAAVNAECGPHQAIVGVSADPMTHVVHGVLCSSDSNAFTHTTCTGLAFDKVDSATTDWDVGYLKGECPSTAIGAGLTSDNAMLACCAAVPAHTSCTTQTVATDAGTSRESTASGDWDVGMIELECGPGRFVAGVSRNVTTGALHAIRCCN